MQVFLLFLDICMNLCYDFYGDGMKFIVKFFRDIIISIWVVIAIFATVCLISSNDYGASVFGDHTLFIVDNKSLSEYGFDKYDIVFVEKGLEKDYNVGDKVFFYNGNKETKSFINFGEITDVRRADGGLDSFVFGNKDVSYDDIVGAGNGAVVLKKWGMFLGLLESRWGFMFLVILPTLYAVVYEVYTIAVEVKKKAKDELKEIDKE